MSVTILDVPVSPPRPAALVPAGILVLVLLPLLLLPLAAIFVFALRGGLDAFVVALRAPDAQFALRFSLLIAFATAAINGVLGTFAAYVLSKYHFPGEQPLGIIVNLPVAIPTVVVGTSLLLLWGPIGLLGRLLGPLGLQPMFTPVGILLAHLFVTFPYMLGAVKPLLDELEATYEEVAYTIGANRWQTFLYVILPALRGGLFTGALLTFAHSLGEFGATVLVSGNLRLRTQTAPLYIFAQFEAGNLAAANAVAAVLALLSFMIFFFLLRYSSRAGK
ncbi:MAG: ABC transporter permease subunit [Ardenticatenaceae bacterium]|nr:ABC transporter permease subunit [Ardenticatenaceae bacterium]HBY98336.1 molybdate ABC transporter permease subunit [Chloroflexota bacterium]